MDFINHLREKSAVQKIEKFIPAIAFLGGFSWDSMTIGHKVYGRDLILLSFYYLIALVSIFFIATRLVANDENCEDNTPSFFSKILNREWHSSWIDRLTWLVQFCFGNLYSALVICYFKSSGSIAAFVIVLLLVSLLVGNEFLKEKYEKFGVCLAFFCLLGTMFFNFLIPHLVHAMGALWFFLSTFLSIGICYLLWLKSSRDKRTLVAPIAITLVLSIAYVANWIAPVPLVLKQQIVCKNFNNETYSCDADKLNFWQRIGNWFKTSDSRWNPATWFRPVDDAIISKDNDLYIPSDDMIIRGGRDAGYRSFSRKKNIPEGTYRVETAYKDGAVIGSSTFKVIEGMPKNGFVRDSLR